MNAKLSRLAQRRTLLIEQAAQQRAALSQASEPWRNLLARADQGIAVLRYLKNHPVWLASAGGALLAVLGPGRLWRWFGRGLFAWRMVQRLRIW
ncbi:MAG TPA: YqjK-like family protein [Gammaproteobacteria bacterium]